MYISKNLLDILLFVLNYSSQALSILYIGLILVKINIGEKLKISFKLMHVVFITSIILLASLATFLQYQVWLSNDFTSLLTTIPVEKGTPLPGLLIIFKSFLFNTHGYFIHYTLIHFWMSVVWSFLSTAILMIILISVKKYKPYLINNNELNLIFAALLVLLWPNLIVFVILMFLLFVLHSILNYFRGDLRTVILPSIIASIFILFVYQFVFGESILYINQLKFIVK